MLLNEVRLPEACWSLAPQFISIALTNACDLTCPYCYASKAPGTQSAENVIRWGKELDSQGCLGIGFGGGEPTLHPSFTEICNQLSGLTRLAISFTTHGHHLDDQLIAALVGAVHYVRVSIDGVGRTYETLRGRRFPAIRQRLEALHQLSSFGINCVVNARTIDDLDAVADLARDAGASELLLLPERQTRHSVGIDPATARQFRSWVSSYRGPVPLTVSEYDSHDLPTCPVAEGENGLRAYAHIDANGHLKQSSYDQIGTLIDSNGVMAAMARLQRFLQRRENENLA